MSLPKDFQSVIKDEYGNFGWELANSFSFIAEFLGYKVFDISAVETALKIIATESGSSLTKYAHPTSLSYYLKLNYPKVHKVFIRRAKAVNVSDEDKEIERKEKVIDRFAKYAISNNLDFVQLMINEFYRKFIMDTLTIDVTGLFEEIEEEINKETDN